MDQKVVKWFLGSVLMLMMLSTLIQFVGARVDELKITIAAREVEYEQLRQEYKDAMSTDGYIVPEADYLVFPFTPDSKIFVTSQFHLRANPFEANIGPNQPEEKLHKGIDIASRKQTLIVSTVSGKVVGHWPAPNGYWRGAGIHGGKIIIRDKNGVFHAFSHLSETFVTGIAGRNEVEAGQPIGRMGNTGLTTGAHLHYEIYTSPSEDGEVVEGETVWFDPIYYFDIKLDENGQVMFPEEAQPLTTR